VVTATDVGEHDGRPSRGLGEIGEGEPDEDDLTYCKWGHASSSSGRFQSSASSASLEERGFGNRGGALLQHRHERPASWSRVDRLEEPDVPLLIEDGFNGFD
jgi:hypothetical protein